MPARKGGDAELGIRCGTFHTERNDTTGAADRMTWMGCGRFDGVDVIACELL
jgi:hypothetical protein